MKTKLVNDKRCLSIVNYQLSILLLLAAMLFAGCSKDTPVDNPDDPNNPSNPDTPVNVVMQSVALTGLVKDASGIPLSGVKVTTGSLNATTGKDGTFSFTQAGTVDSIAVVKFEKSGYFTLTRSGDQADAMYIEAMMYPTGNSDISLQTTFDASAAKSLQAGGVTIDLPAGCMAKADGSAYSGTVKADVLYLAPDNANAAAMMPGGDLTCIRSDNSKELVMPIGIMNAVFTDNAGNPLEIKSKTDVKISFPALSGATDASIPLWTFSEPKGVWVEEGTVALQGNSYTGTVTHFTGYAAGKPEKSVTIQVHATACDKPASGASVMIEYYGWIYMDWGSIANGMTNGSGDCMLKAPVNTNISIQTTYNGKSQVTSFATENYGLQIAYVKFDDNCDNGDIPKSLSVMYHTEDDATVYFTYDNWGMIRRNTVYDPAGISEPDDDGWFVEIMDHSNCHGYLYQHVSNSGMEWDDFSPADCNDGTGNDATNGDPGWYDIRRIDKVQQVINGYNLYNAYYYNDIDNEGDCYIMCNSDMMKPFLGIIVLQDKDATVAGKTCKVYYSFDHSWEMYVWNRVVLRLLVDGENIYEALAVTTDVPAEAFTNHIVAPNWIK